MCRILGLRFLLSPKASLLESVLIALGVSTWLLILFCDIITIIIAWVSPLQSQFYHFICNRGDVLHVQWICKL